MYTRTLTMGQSGTPQGKWINTDNLYPFLSHLRDFRNVENVILDGWEPHGFSEGGLKKYFGHFGEHLRSLELGGQRMSQDSFIVLLGLLPNLENLSVKERVEGNEESRVPAVLPKLSGRLTVRVHTRSLFPTLCKFTLRFRVICLQEHQHDYQQLINACAETLVDFRAMSLDYGTLSFQASSAYSTQPPIENVKRDVSFAECGVLREVTLVKKSMEDPDYYLTGIISGITSKHIRRITIGFVEPLSDPEIQNEIESKTWEKFDEAIARLAERTLDNGRRLELELHVCGNPTTGLFYRMFPRFAEIGRLGVEKTLFIWKGPILSLLSRWNGGINRFG